MPGWGIFEGFDPTEEDLKRAEEELSKPGATLFGLPVMFTDDPVLLGSGGDIVLEDPCDILVIYSVRHKACGWSGEVNRKQLREGFLCPRCAAELN